MELGKTSAREPVVFDFSKLNLSDNLQEHKGYLLFLGGHASFGDELKDAVALSQGIDDEGHLDMAMYEAAEATQDYLQGRQGQPVVLANHVVSEGKTVRVDAMVGVLGQDDKLIGLLPRGRNANAGIALQGQCYVLSAYSMGEGLRLERCMPFERDWEEGGYLPLTGPYGSIGKPERTNAHSDYHYAQELVAGEDISAWLEEWFPDTADQYEMVLGLLMGLRTAEAQAYVLHEPYTDMLQTEQQTLQRISRELSHAHNRISLHERAIQGEYAQASLALASIYDEATFLTRRRLPRTNDSDRNSVVAEVRTLRDIGAREHAVQSAQGYLSNLVVARTFGDQ